MAFTLLHTADLHLGKSFSELPPERAGQRRADLLATLTRLCRKARELRVDALCIAGDLFDHPTPAAPLLAATRRALADAAVPVLLAPGNHDPLDEKSPYLDNRWPDNVRIASAPGWQRMAVSSVDVLAFGYACGAAHHSPWKDFSGCADDALLILHAACLAPSLAAGAGYYPFTPNDIPPCGYLALGHHHRPVQVQRAPLAWYAGSPEPLEPEVTPAAAVLVTIDGGTSSVELLDVATRRHHLLTLDVTGLTAEDIWDRALAQAALDDLLTLKLTGLLEARESLDLSTLQAELSARCFGAQIWAQEMHLPAESSATGGVLGMLQEIARERLEDLVADDAQRTRLEHAARYATLALEGKL